MADPAITRHFVSVDTPAGPKQILYRKAGSGPLLVMIHQSPSSSAEYEPMIREYFHEFTVIAPDTLGYGLSDPIDIDQPTIEDFAKRLADFFDALGIDDACIYGMHTGSKVAIEFARLFPERTRAIYAEGVLFLTQEEKDFILGGYFADFTPLAEGGHLPKIWARMRDQLIFFPWFNRTHDGRMKHDVPQPAALTDYVLNLLRAGENEPDAYAAAFVYPTADALVQLTVPGFIAFSHPDPLAEHIPRMPPLPATVVTELFEHRGLSYQKARDYFMEYAESVDLAPGPSDPQSGGVWKDIVAIPGGDLFVRRVSGTDGKRPVLFVHSIGSSSAALLPVVDGIALDRPLLLPDLPGHGETGGKEFSIERSVDALLGLLDTLSIERADIVASETGGQIAAALAARAPERIGRMIVDEPWLIAEGERREFSEHIVPPLEPNYYGGHLLAIWYSLRDGEIFWPWFRTRNEFRFDRPPHIDPRDLQNRLADFLKSAGVYPDAIRQVIAFDQIDCLKRVENEILFTAEAGGPHVAHGADAAVAARQGKFTARSHDPAQLKKLIVEHLTH